MCLDTRDRPVSQPKDSKLIVTGLNTQTVIDELRVAFGAKEQQIRAFEKLKTLKQGSDSLSVFFTKFELVAAQAGWLPGDDTAQAAAANFYLISLIRTAISFKLTMMICSTTQILPTTYVEWKNLALQVETNQGMIPGNRPTNFSRPSSNTATQQDQSQGGVPASRYSAGNSQGVPMDIGKQRFSGCYHCGKDGHQAKNCRSPCQYCKASHPGQRCPQYKLSFNRQVFLSFDKTQVWDEDKKAIKDFASGF